MLRGCCERDFLGLGLSEYRYTRAIGHSPEVSRRNYLARFKGAVLDDDSTAEFKRAAQRVTELIHRPIAGASTPIKDGPGDTTGIQDAGDIRNLRVSEGIRTPDPLDHNQVL